MHEKVSKLIIKSNFLYICVQVLSTIYIDVSWHGWRSSQESIKCIILIPSECTWYIYRKISPTLAQIQPSTHEDIERSIYSQLQSEARIRLIFLMLFSFVIYSLSIRYISVTRDYWRELCFNTTREVEWRK